MTAARWLARARLFALLLLAVAGGSAARAQSSDAWRPLFDGKTLTNWESTKFGGEGPVKVENGQIILEAGKSMTGITWTGAALPTTNYEIALQAMRVEGRDFFAGVTFPVGDSFCSLILGGWGGTVCGISSLDGEDAAHNETRKLHRLNNKRWYKIRLRVLPDKLMAWLDDEKIIDVSTKGKEISVRQDIDQSKPFGLASWQTTAAIRDIKIRKVGEGEK